MSIKIEVVNCPKCKGKMVPLSKMEPGAVIIPIAEWTCVNCGYTVRA